MLADDTVIEWLPNHVALIHSMSRYCRPGSSHSRLIRKLSHSSGDSNPAMT